MQFSCESCKAQLQIADEKVRGKRLIVRCKRCGAKIGISDPALGPPKAARPASAAPAPSPAQPAPQARPAPASGRAAGPAHRDSDTESTRAMDSDLLEQALQASKADDPSLAPAAPEPAPEPEPPAAPPGEAAVWFAMLHGKQAGPMTHADLTAKANEGAVGPRTYLWKDGMEAWQRAKDLAELQGLFPAPPEPPPPAPAPPPPVGQGLREFSTPDFVAPVSSLPPAAVPEQPKAAAAPASPAPAPRPAAKEEEDRTTVDPLPLGERVHQEGVAKELFADQTSGSQKSPKDLADWAAIELDKKAAPAQPRPASPRSAVMFQGSAPAQSRLPLVMIGVVGVLAAAAIALWLVFGPGQGAPQPEKKDAAAPAAPAKPEQKPEAAKAPETKPAEAKPPEKPAPPEAQTGLTADQVRKKLDENKGALQGCIDEALRRDPNLRVGKIHIATTIAPSGQVTTAKIDKNTVDQSPLGACLRRATRRIAFPPFSGDAFDVDIPIVVTAGE